MLVAMHKSNNNTMMVIIRGHPPRKSIRRERSQTIFCTKILVLAREPYAELRIKYQTSRARVANNVRSNYHRRRRSAVVKKTDTRKTILYFMIICQPYRTDLSNSNIVCNLYAWKKTRFAACSIIVTA